MDRIRLYWNHICILHKKEKEFLDQLVEKMKAFNIELEVTCFGLGYTTSMSKYLEQPDAVLPDVIVSIDLEVFEYEPTFNKIKDDLYDLCENEQLYHKELATPVYRNSKLLPFVGIPLVYFTKNVEAISDQKITEIESLSIGGVDNSAIKMVAKTVWESYGKEEAEKLLQNSVIGAMPIVAFSNVKKSIAQTALVPSIYAMRADQETEFLQVPKEGALIIPSFICARTTISYEHAIRIIESIVCEELCDFYVENGNLISFSRNATKESKYRREEYFTANSEFLQELSGDEFYQTYKMHIPYAHSPVSD